MSALKGLSQFKISYELLDKYMSLYKAIGKEEDKIEFLKKHNDEYIKLTLKDDIKHIFDMFFKHSISPYRFSKIIEGNNLNDLSKNEIMLRNITEIMNRCYSSLEFKFDDIEMIDLCKLLYKDYYKDTNIFKEKIDDKSFKDKLNTLFRMYKESSFKVEELLNYTCFLVDFIKLSPFKYHNDIIGLIYYYCLINKFFEAFKFESFFKLLSLNKDKYDKAMLKSFYLYDEGYSDSSELLVLVISLASSALLSADMIYEKVIFNKQLKKTNIVEEVVYSLNETFSKKEVMDRLPDISVSTIDRKLKEMQEEGKISSFGTGRGAKWILLDESRKRGEF